MAYSSFSETELKYGFLCYPSSTVDLKSINYRDGINEANNEIMVLGLPLKKESISEAKKLLSGKLSELEKQIIVPNNL